MKIAILGTGNSGCAQAAMLTKRGHEVRLIKTSNSIHNENFEVISKTNQIECIDTTNNNEHFISKLSLVTKTIEEGIQGADVVLILTQSLQHRTLAERVAPLLRDGQIVWLIPGNMGSMVFYNHTKDKNIIYVESESTPYDARIVEPGVVKILFKNVRNAVSFFNPKHKTYLETVDKVFGRHKYCRTNIIEGTMHNPNMVVHTVGAITSAGRIEKTNGEFWMYKEAFTPSIWNVIKQLDKEKVQIIKTFKGEQAYSYLDACKWRNEEDLNQDSLVVFQNYANTGGPKGPDKVNGRYIMEDVPMELCLLENLATIAKIETPITSSLISIASCLVNEDLRKRAYDIDMILEYVNTFILV